MRPTPSVDWAALLAGPLTPGMLRDMLAILAEGRAELGLPYLVTR